MLFYFISPLLNTSARKLQCRQHETFLSETFPAQWWPRLFPSSLGTGFLPSVPDRVATWGHQCWPRHPAEPLEPAPPLAERKLQQGLTAARAWVLMWRTGEKTQYYPCRTIQMLQTLHSPRKASGKSTCISKNRAKRSLFHLSKPYIRQFTPFQKIQG